MDMETEREKYFFSALELGKVVNVKPEELQKIQEMRIFALVEFMANKLIEKGILNSDEVKTKIHEYIIQNLELNKKAMEMGYFLGKKGKK